jgi:hypothetical protein
MPEPQEEKAFQINEQGSRSHRHELRYLDSNLEQWSIQQFDEALPETS